MDARRLSYVFFFSTVAITVVAAESAGVSFWDTTVTLTCPGTEDVEWYRGKEVLPNGTDNQINLNDYTEKKDGMYRCSYKVENDKKVSHYFFIKAKVCKGCVDMSMSVAFGAIFIDVMFTVFIVLMVYFCAKQKAGSAAPQRATQPRQGRGQARAPPPPDPDYQPLNPATRSNDVYAQAHRR